MQRTVFHHGDFNLMLQPMVGTAYVRVGLFDSKGHTVRFEDVHPDLKTVDRLMIDGRLSIQNFYIVASTIGHFFGPPVGLRQSEVA